MHALIDGEEVQWRNKIARAGWNSDTWQSLPSAPWMFDPEVYEWRLKPKVLRYRVALMKTGSVFWTATAENGAAMDETDDFVRWLGDWQEVEA